MLYQDKLDVQGRIKGDPAMKLANLSCGLRIEKSLPGWGGGVLPIMAYTEMLPPERGAFFRLQVYM